MNTHERLTVVNADPGSANVISITHNSQDDIYISAEWNERIQCPMWMFCSRQASPSCLSETRWPLRYTTTSFHQRQAWFESTVAAAMVYFIDFFRVICVTDEKPGRGWQIKFGEKNEMKKLDQNVKVIVQWFIKLRSNPILLLCLPLPFIMFTALTCPPWPLSIKQTVNPLILSPTLWYFCAYLLHFFYPYLISMFTWHLLK